MPNKAYSAVEKFFENFSSIMSRIVGTPAWFVFSVSVIVVWLPSRMLFPSAELWHLVINTFTTIFTFLMMSLLHASQSKWKKSMEAMEKRQERTLKLLEKDAADIRSELGNSKGGDKTNNDKSTSPKKDSFITSVL